MGDDKFPSAASTFKHPRTQSSGPLDPVVSSPQGEGTLGELFKEQVMHWSILYSFVPFILGI